MPTTLQNRTAQRPANTNIFSPTPDKQPEKDKMFGDIFRLFGGRPDGPGREAGQGLTIYDNNSVWSDDVKFAPIGSVDPTTGEFRQSWWIKSAQVLDYINKPFEYVGTALSAGFLADPEILMKIEKAEKNGEEVNKFKLYNDKYRDLPVWKQMMAEAPLAFLIPGAGQLRMALGGVKGGIKGVTAAAAKAALYVPAKFEQAAGFAIKKTVVPAAKGIGRGIYKLSGAENRNVNRMASHLTEPEDLIENQIGRRLADNEEEFLVAEGLAPEPVYTLSGRSTQVSSTPPELVKYHKAMKNGQWAAAMRHKKALENYDYTNNPTIYKDWQLWDLTSKQLDAYAEGGMPVSSIYGKAGDDYVGAILAGEKPAATLSTFTQRETGMIAKAKKDKNLTVKRLDTEYNDSFLKYAQDRVAEGKVIPKAQISKYWNGTFKNADYTPPESWFVMRKDKFKQTSWFHFDEIVNKKTEAMIEALINPRLDFDAARLLSYDMEIGKMLGYTRRDIAAFVKNNYGWQKLKKAGMINAHIHPPRWALASRMSKEDYISARLADEPVQDDAFAEDLIKGIEKYSGEEKLDPKKIYKLEKQPIGGHMDDLYVKYDANGEVVAFTSVRAFTDETTGVTRKMIDFTAVEPEMQGKGIGKKLYERAFEDGAIEGHIENEVSAGLKHKIWVERAIQYNNPVTKAAVASYPKLKALAKKKGLIVEDIPIEELTQQQYRVYSNGGPKSVHTEAIDSAYKKGRTVPSGVLVEEPGLVYGTSTPYIGDIESLVKAEGTIFKGEQIWDEATKTWKIDPSVPKAMWLDVPLDEQYLKSAFTQENPEFVSELMQDMMDLGMDVNEHKRLLNWAVTEQLLKPDTVPKIGQQMNAVKSLVNPGLNDVPQVRLGYVGAMRYQNTQTTRMTYTVVAMENAIEGVFGKAALKGSWRGMRANYIGAVEPGTGLDKVVGSLPHVFENASKYRNLTPEMLEVISKWNKTLAVDREFTNATLSSGLKKPKNFIGEVEGVYVPHAFKNGTKVMAEDVLAAAPNISKNRALTLEEYADVAAKFGLEVEDNMTNLMANRLTVTAERRTKHVFLEGMSKQFGVKGVQKNKHVGHKAVQGFGRVYNYGGKNLKAGLDIAALLSPEKTNTIVGAATRLLDEFRGTLLNLDVGIMARQGFLGVLADPFAATKGIGEAITLLGSKRGWLDWYGRNYRRLTSWEQAGLQFRASLLDVTTGIKGQKKMVMEKIPGVDWLNRAQFETTIPVMKVQLADSLMGNMQALRDAKGFWGQFNEVINTVPVLGRLNKNLGGKLYSMTDAELQKEVADVVNNLMGGIEWERIGKTPGFFSKFFVLTEGWTRAQLGLFASAGTRSPRGILARRILAQELGLVAMGSTALSLALTGETPEYDPTSTRFLDVKSPIGFVSILPQKAYFTSALRIVSGQGNTYTDEEGRINRMADATMWFLQSRMGQLPRVAKDLVSGTDFMGREIDSQWKYLAETLTPIIIGDAIEEARLGYWKKDAGGMMARLAVSLTGANPRPYSPTYVRSEARNEIAKAWGYKDWFSMPKTEQSRAFQYSQTLQNLDAEANEYQDSFRSEIERLIADGREWADNEFYTRMNRIATAQVQGKITKKEYDDERAYLRNSYSGQKGLTSYLTNLNDPNLEARFQEWYNEHPLPPEDAAVEEYINIGLRTEQELGSAGWQQARYRQMQYLAQLPDQYQEYVLARQYDWMNKLPAAAKALEMRRRQEIIMGRWWEDYRENRSTRGNVIVRG